MFAGAETQLNFSPPRPQEWNALPNERWHYMNDELVDLVLVNECPDQCSTAHHPDVLARLSPETFRERRWLFTDELHSRCPDQASRISGKDVVFGLCPESGSVLKAELICLSPKRDRIDRSAERPHAVVTSRPRTIQPINAAVGASNEAVSTCGDVHNNLSHVDSRRSDVLFDESNDEKHCRPSRLCDFLSLIHRFLFNQIVKFRVCIIYDLEDFHLDLSNGQPNTSPDLLMLFGRTFIFRKMKESH